MKARARRPFRLHEGKHGAALTVRVTPRSRKTEIAGLQEDGTIRVRVRAPAVEGKANAALVEFLAEVLGVRRSRVEIVAGQTGLDKLLSVLDLTPQEVQRRIEVWLSSHERVRKKRSA